MIDIKYLNLFEEGYNSTFSEYLCLYAIDEIIDNIRSSLVLLLNDSILSNEYIITICKTIDDNLIDMKKTLVSDDYRDFIIDLFDFLEFGVMPEMEIQEEYKQCYNIRTFIDTYIKNEYMQ